MSPRVKRGVRGEGEASAASDTVRPERCNPEPQPTTPRASQRPSQASARGPGWRGKRPPPLRQQGHSQTRAMQPLNPNLAVRLPKTQPMSPRVKRGVRGGGGSGWRGKRPPANAEGSKAAGTLSDPSDATLEPHPMPPRTPTHVTPSGAPPKNPANVTPSEARGLGWRGSVRRPLSHQ